MFLALEEFSFFSELTPMQSLRIASFPTGKYLELKKHENLNHLKRVNANLDYYHLG